MALAIAASLPCAHGNSLARRCRGVHHQRRLDDPRVFGIPTGGTALQSLAESRLPAGSRAPQRHYHAATEEIYFILEGRADMELDGAHAELSPGEAVA